MLIFQGVSQNIKIKHTHHPTHTPCEVLSSTFLRIQPHSSFWLTLTCQQIGFSWFQNTWLCSFCNTLLAFLKNSNLKLLCWGTSWRSCGPCFTLKIWGLRRAARFTALTYKWSMQKHMKTGEKILVPKLETRLWPTSPEVHWALIMRPSQFEPWTEGDLFDETALRSGPIRWLQWLGGPLRLIPVACRHCANMHEMAVHGIDGFPSYSSSILKQTLFSFTRAYHENSWCFCINISSDGDWG